MSKYNYRQELIKEIGWLEKLSQGLKDNITEAEFDYKKYLSDYNNGCGTVCCAYGWMPRLVPESGVQWITKTTDEKVKATITNISKPPYHTFEAIYNLRKIGAESIVGISLIDFMFMGVSYHKDRMMYFEVFKKIENINTNHSDNSSVDDNSLASHIFGVGDKAKLQQVINRISAIIRLLKDGLESNVTLEYVKWHYGKNTVLKHNA